MKLTEDQKKKIDRAVKRFIKSFDEKDKNGKIIGSSLMNRPEMLLSLYKQSFFLKLTTDEERFYAKTIFKEHLPYKPWLEKVSKDPEFFRRELEDWQEMVDPKYERITERRSS